MILDTLETALSARGLITAFMFVGALVWLSYLISNKLTRGHVHGSAIAIALGLVFAWYGGMTTGGNTGLADIPLLAGIGVMGGSMFRDFAIVATAFGADLSTLKRAGLVGGISIVIGVVLSFVVGAVVAVAFGYTDPIAITTIGAGAAGRGRRDAGRSLALAIRLQGKCFPAQYAGGKPGTGTSHL